MVEIVKLPDCFGPNNYFKLSRVNVIVLFDDCDGDDMRAALRYAQERAETAPRTGRQRIPSLSLYRRVPRFGELLAFDVIGEADDGGAMPLPAVLGGTPTNKLEISSEPKRSPAAA